MTQQQTSNRDGIRIVSEDKAVISPSLGEITVFLGDIDKEIRSMIFLKDNLEEVRMSVWKTFEDIEKIVSELWELLETKRLKETAKKTILDHVNETNETINSINSQNAFAIRSQMICLFAYMETLASIITVYDEGLSLRDNIMEKTKNNLKKWIKKYLLTDENDYFSQHREVYKNIWPQDIKDVRNSLTHFYSPSKLKKIVLVTASVWDKPEKLKKIFKSMKWYKGTVPLSPQDFYHLLAWAQKKILFDRADESEKDMETFRKKIDLVNEVFNASGTKMITMK